MKWDFGLKLCLGAKWIFGLGPAMKTEALIHPNLNQGLIFSLNWSRSWALLDPSLIFWAMAGMLNVRSAELHH